ncbi:MAG: competence/damage-inducible protein A [Chthoniobacterales bacterium]|nr:competence/damage-inducible protein A [Chthoniobacterales bacterium]
MACCFAEVNLRSMRIAEILCTGTELLLGHTVDRHLPWLARQLFPLGFRVGRFTIVPDGEPIKFALQEALARKPEIVLVSGGLGPTSDDLTRESLAEVLGTQLVESSVAIEAIRKRLQERKRSFIPSMRKQALHPPGALLLENNFGTAPGIAQKIGQGYWVFLLPGPPRELQPMFLDYVVPLIKEYFPKKDDQIIEKIYTVVGLGESAIEELIGREIEANSDIEVGYCARPNEVDLRLIGKKNVLESWDAKIRNTLGDHLACEDGLKLEEVVIKELRQERLKISVAESCTGGLIASRLTDVSGASEVFVCGVVAYSNEAKSNLLGVPVELIASHGAVSQEVAKAMAEGIRKLTKSDFAIATTGIAGPSGGTPQKPVGTCFIAVAANGKPTVCLSVYLPTTREAFKFAISQTALNLLQKVLKKVKKS